MLYEYVRFQKLLYKYSTISHLIDIFGQLAPTRLPRPRYRGCLSVNSFLNIGSMAVSLSISSVSLLAPNSSGFVRCLRLWSGATFGDEWWCECCCNVFISFRWGVVERTLSRSRSLSVSLCPIDCGFCLCRCFVRFFSETLRCIGPDGEVLGSCELCCWNECECSWQRCGLGWFRGDCRCLACDNVCVSHRSLWDTTKLPLIGVPIWTLTRLWGSWFSTVCEEWEIN